jgi:hypothetical protein
VRRACQRPASDAAPGREKDEAPEPPAALAPFLAKMAAMTARPLASFDAAPTYLQQTMTYVAPAPLAAAPSGAVLVTGL